MVDKVGKNRFYKGALKMVESPQAGNYYPNIAKYNDISELAGYADRLGWQRQALSLVRQYTL